ncbi:MAG: VOC family protein [Solirubrobacterales bacterium]
MIEHLALTVSDLRRSAEFYDAALAPLGWRRLRDEAGAVGWGLVEPVLLVVAGPPPTAGAVQVRIGARGSVAVRMAFSAAVAGGGQALTPPARHGARTSAVVADPDGHRIEIAAL